jgi:hypothetical protein
MRLGAVAEPEARWWEATGQRAVPEGQGLKRTYVTEAEEVETEPKQTQGGRGTWRSMGGVAQ